MIKILLLLAVLILIGLLVARFVIPLFFNKIKEDVGLIKEKTREEDFIFPPDESTEEPKAKRGRPKKTA